MSITSDSNLDAKLYNDLAKIQNDYINHIEKIRNSFDMIESYINKLHEMQNDSDTINKEIEIYKEKMDQMKEKLYYLDNKK